MIVHALIFQLFAVFLKLIKLALQSSRFRLHGDELAAGNHGRLAFLGNIHNRFNDLLLVKVFLALENLSQGICLFVPSLKFLYTILLLLNHLLQRIDSTITLHNSVLQVFELIRQLLQLLDFCDSFGILLSLISHYVPFGFSITHLLLQKVKICRRDTLFKNFGL